MSNKKWTRRSQEFNDSKRWRTYVLIFTFGLLLLSGFFFAGRQHFSSMDYGMRNSKLRKQIDELESEKRRLMLAREISLSPGEIKKAAKRAGLKDKLTIDNQIESAAFTRKENGEPKDVTDPKPMVVRTSAVSHVKSSIAAAFVAKNPSFNDSKKKNQTE